MDIIADYLQSVNWGYLAARVVIALIILIVVWIVAGWIGKLCLLGFRRAKADEALSRFCARTAKILVVILGLMICLSYFGVQTTGLAAVLGGSVLAIGLAFQGSLANLAAGVMLLVFRPFKIGNVISAAGETGKVAAIGLFATDLDTPDNRRIIIPNGALFGSTIENISFHETRRVDINVGSDYAADLDATRAALERAIEATPDKLEDGAHQVVLAGLGDSAVDWQVRMWCKAADYWAVKDAGTRAIKLALDEAGVGIPFPQLAVHVEKMGAAPAA